MSLIPLRSRCERWHADNFRDAILLAANLADSVATTAGRIAGALHGYSGIPQAWKNKPVQHERISGIAGNLFDRAPEDAFLSSHLCYGTGVPCQIMHRQYIGFSMNDPGCFTERTGNIDPHRHYPFAVHQLTSVTRTTLVRGTAPVCRILLLL